MQKTMRNPTRPDTWLPQSLAVGQGQFLRSGEHLGRSSKARNLINAKKVKCDGPMDELTNGQVSEHVSK